MFLLIAKGIKDDRGDITGVVLTASIGEFLTVLSQIDTRAQIGFGICWLCLLWYCAVRKSESLKLNKSFFITIFLYLGLVLFACASFIATGDSAYLTSFPLLLGKALFMYVVGYVIADYFDVLRKWFVLIYVYIGASLIYTFWVLFNYFPGLSAWLSSQVYFFASKNSYGQIAGVSIACAVFLLFTETSIISITLIQLISITLMQCRTTLLALVAFLFVFLVYKNKKRWILIFGVAVVATMLAVPSFRTYLVHVVALDKYSGNDLNGLSSGRLSLWAKAMTLTHNNPLIGNGSYYVDCFYINCYANVGILGSLFVFGIWSYRVYVSLTGLGQRDIRNGSSYTWLSGLTGALVVFYLCESLFEAHPPFGPGTSSFLFWLLCGYLDSYIANKVGRVDKCSGDE